MGNAISEEYNLINNNEPQSLPKINLFHRKGKPYGKLLDYKLNSNRYNDWGYYEVYDLRCGNYTWNLSLKVYGDELDFIFYSMRDIELKFPLYYSSKSNLYMTMLKGRHGLKYVELELYADNIHSQRLQNLNLNLEFFIWGFIKFDNQDKIPIALRNKKCKTLCASPIKVD